MAEKFGKLFVISLGKIIENLHDYVKVLAFDLFFQKTENNSVFSFFVYQPLDQRQSKLRIFIVQSLVRIGILRAQEIRWAVVIVVDYLEEKAAN